MDSARKEFIRGDVLRMQPEKEERSPGPLASQDLAGRSHKLATLSCLNGVLPDEGLMPGSLVECVSNTDGVGVWTLALLMGWHACGERRSLAVADPERCFYPPAAALKLGIDLERLIVIRPATWAEAYLAIEQSLRCPAIGAVIGRCRQLRAADGRRFQLAAEVGGGLGLLLRSEEAQASPSFAALRLRVTPLQHAAATRLIRVEVLRCRGGQAERFVILEMDDETGHVRVPAPVAHPATRAQ